MTDKRITRAGIYGASSPWSLYGRQYRVLLSTFYRGGSRDPVIRPGHTVGKWQSLILNTGNLTISRTFEFWSSLHNERHSDHFPFSNPVKIKVRSILSKSVRYWKACGGANDIIKQEIRLLAELRSYNLTAWCIELPGRGKSSSCSGLPGTERP